jgi:predicted DNA-binding ribbon-helix-helix protein
MVKMHKRSIRIARHSTSLSLEAEFWDELKRLARLQKLSLNQLVAKIDKERTGNLSSALRLYVLRELKR